MKRPRHHRKPARPAQPPPQPAARPHSWPLAAIAVAAIVAAAALAWLWPGQEPPVPITSGLDSASPAPARESTAPPPLPEIAPSPYLNTRSEAKYVGTASCRECHPNEHGSYMETGHSKSFAKVDPATEPPAGEFERREPGWIYRAQFQNNQLRHQQLLEPADGERITLVDHPVSYLMGSGRFARTYLIDLDGIFVESPLTWYASTRSWNLSPGYERSLGSQFCRNVGQGCAFCHVGHSEPSGLSEYRLAIHDSAIGCERCHGPGSLHVEARKRVKQRQTSEGDDLTIVNPRKLSRELAESVCNQCHLETEAIAMTRGRRREDFRPGLRWSDFVVNYAFEQASDEMTVTGHVQQLRLSRCYQQSDSLTCITCHDPHHSPAPADRLAYRQNQCLQCHEDASCKLPPARRESENRNDCAACHMPRSDTNVPHVAFTHHQIGIHNKPTTKPADDLAGNLVPVLDDSHLPPLERQRALGLAYMRLAVDNLRSEHFQTYRDRSDSLLRAVVDGGIQDSAVQAVLMIHDKDAGNLAAAKERAQLALSDEAIAAGDRITATEVLASIHVQQRDFRAARPLLNDLIQWRILPRDWLMLARCLRHEGDLNGAIAALENVVQLDPTELLAYADLAHLYNVRGEPEKSRQTLERLKLVESRMGLAKPQEQPASE